MACYTRLYLLAGLFLFLFCVSSVAAAGTHYTLDFLVSDTVATDNLHL